jgi:hypothetical protein
VGVVTTFLLFAEIDLTVAQARLRRGRFRPHQRDRHQQGFYLLLAFPLAHGCAGPEGLAARLVVTLALVNVDQSSLMETLHYHASDRPESDTELRPMMVMMGSTSCQMVRSR